MTASDHHPMIVDSNCTNSTITMVKCVRVWCCCCGGCFGLQMDRRLEHIAIQTLRHAKTVFAVFANIFNSRRNPQNRCVNSLMVAHGLLCCIRTFPSNEYDELLLESDPSLIKNLAL